jgi:CheY-like chemotaxis protein
MPKLDGYHAAQQIQGLSPRPRIIIVTARNFESDRHALKGAGVDAFLPKPFANKDLILAVASLMKKKHA